MPRSPPLVAAAIAIAGFAAGYAIAAQPHMNNALAALQTAHAELNAADHDKGGYRAAALNLVRQAIEKVNAGIRAGG